MPVNWKDLLSDRSKYPDDFAITFKDGSTATLAEMRSYDTETRGELTRSLTARERDLQKREKDVNDATVQVGTLIERTAAAAGLSVDDLIAGKTPSKRAVAAATELDEADPLIGVVVKELKSLKSDLAAVRQDNERLRKDALGPMLNTYLDDFYESSWDKLSPTLPEGAEVTRDQALKYATDNGYKDAKGRLDLRKAIKDLTYDARVKAEAKKLATEERKKMDDERILAAVPKPGNLGARVKTDKSLTNAKGQTKTFDEMLADAQNDTDMWRQIQHSQQQQT